MLARAHRAILCCAVLAGAETAAAADAKLAVMPLTGRRVPKETVLILDELVVAEVDGRGQYKVISASDINAILGLDKMRQAVGCDDVTCAAEIGGALGAEYLIAGSVSRLGGEIIVTLKLINVVKTEVESRAQKRVRDDERVYARAIEETVAELFGAGPPAAGRTPAAASSEQPARASLKVLAAGDAEGEIYIDGDSNGLRTPNVVYLAPGQYEVEVRFESGAYGVQRVRLRPGEQRELRIGPDNVRKGGLRIETQPTGATVRVNGEEVGVAPILIDDVAAGSVFVEADMSGYVGASQQVRVEPTQMTRVSLQLTKTIQWRLGAAISFQHFERRVTILDGNGNPSGVGSDNPRWVTNWMVRLVNYSLRDYYIAFMADVELGGMIGGSGGLGLTFQLGESFSFLVGAAARAHTRVTDSSSLGYDGPLSGAYVYIDVPIEIELAYIFVIAKPSFILVAPEAQRGSGQIVESPNAFSVQFAIGYSLGF